VDGSIPVEPTFMRYLITGPARRAYLLGAPIVAVALWLASLVLFGIVFAAGESSTQPTGIWAALQVILSAIAAVLAFPFMYITRTATGLALSRTIFSGDSGAVFGLTGLSALFWATVSVWAYRARMRRTPRAT
jgi:hypothetical protein